jgi:GST-like protein
MAIQLFTWATPNGRKISIMLEELGAAYEVHPINIMKDEQFSPEYLSLNPNNKIPTIVDSDGPGGAPVILAESGAILVYLAQKFRSFLFPPDMVQQALVLQWVMFQMGGIGPMFGQLHHFRRYAADQAYSLQRYEKEVHRLYGVLNKRLDRTEYLAGVNYSIADIAAFPWISHIALHNMPWDQIPNVKRWFDLVGARDAVVRGMAVPVV